MTYSLMYPPLQKCKQSSKPYFNGFMQFHREYHSTKVTHIFFYSNILIIDLLNKTANILNCFNIIVIFTLRSHFYMFTQLMISPAW